MSESQHENKPDEHIHYPDDITIWCELDWGKGFLSPGGREEVAKIIEGIGRAPAEQNTVYKQANNLLALVNLTEPAQHVMFLHEGVIHEEGTPDEVLKHPRKERTRAFLTGFTDFNF